ncbi:MAG: N-methyl-L-tryptophan oxidase [Phycisphaerae bacterium]
MAEVFDSIVVGIGGIGSGIVHSLCRRGRRVLGLEAHGPAHALGSSHGQTRMIRRAYFEHPDYIPLLDASYDQWRQFEKDCDKTLFLRHGLYLAGPPEGTIVKGVLEAKRVHDLSIDQYDPKEARRRWPQFKPDADMTVLFEEDAGYLLIEECILAFVERSRALGATLLFETPMTNWEALSSGGYRVTCGDREFESESVVFSVGPWASRWLDTDTFDLTVRRKPVFWFHTGQPQLQAAYPCPAFGFETSTGFMYGIPTPGHDLMKAGNHDGGETVDDPSSVDRNIRPSERDEATSFLRSYTTASDAALRDQSVCMYTMTPDEHFILDQHPDHNGVYVACGFSGHGYKFASLLGEVIADWTSEGQTSHPVGFLALNRSR